MTKLADLEELAFRQKRAIGFLISCTRSGEVYDGDYDQLMKEMAAIEIPKSEVPVIKKAVQNELALLEKKVMAPYNEDSE